MIGRPLQWALAATVLSVAVVLLTEEPADVVAARPTPEPGASPAATRSTAAPRAPSAPLPATSGPWPAPTEASLRAWSGPPAVPAAPSPVVAAVQPKAPAPTVAAVDTPPRAPALGYELIGTVSEAGVMGALVGNTQRALWVRPGDTVDGTWRVVQVNANGVELLWLPQQLPARLGYRAP